MTAGYATFRFITTFSQDAKTELCSWCMKRRNGQFNPKHKMLSLSMSLVPLIYQVQGVVMLTQMILNCQMLEFTTG
jgi:hypothetical protein